MNRDDFLRRIRGALHRREGVPVEAPPPLLAPLTSWNTDELITMFKQEHEAVGGTVHIVETVAEAKAKLRELLERLEPRSFIHTTDVPKNLLRAVSLPLADDPAEADVGISGVRCALATTGSLVLTSEVGRRASLLPMTHIAFVRAEQLVPSMAEALATRLPGDLPSAWVQATGPSRTADIELTLTTGVHGPGVVHVILIR